MSRHGKTSKNLFGKKNKSDVMRSMISETRKQKYRVMREAASVQAVCKKTETEIKNRAKSGKMDEAKILAKSLIGARKTLSHLRITGAHLDTVISELNCQISSQRMEGCIQSSTGIMKSMSALVKIPELRSVMMGMSKEMHKMGLLEEMIDDTMSPALGDPEMDEATDAEVGKILKELTTDFSARAPDPVMDSLPAGAEGEVDDNMEDLRRHLEELRS
ncbi:unnamed protein product [Calicophoron daubneyi]|uniref:Charged multivesicular body protein 3 n=1 Tax=Calicophoron daubneyi TaxID=300641 RepID=A0AAV2TQ00_CALDB